MEKSRKTNLFFYIVIFNEYFETEEWNLMWKLLLPPKYFRKKTHLVHVTKNYIGKKSHATKLLMHLVATLN